MKAIVCESFGPPEALVVKEVESPALAAEAVRVRVHYCSVNFPDALMIQGLHQYKLTPPFIPGGEFAGVVTAVGAKVRGLIVGDAVCCLSFSGGFAEEAAVPSSRVQRLPPDVDLAEACCLMVTYGTALHALVQRAQLRSGESLLVLGAAGGSGAAAVQVGKLLGARVIAAVSSEAKLAFARAHGADEGFIYTAKPIKEAINELTDKRGVDVVYDPVGGDYAESALRSMAWNGRYLVVGFAAGSIPQFKANLALLKGCAIVGVFTGEFMTREPELAAANIQRLADWFEKGQLRPAVSERVTLDQVPAALRALMDRKAIGKIVAALPADG